MNPFQISKQTEDKVKLAKKIIQDKYQNIIFQQKLQKQKWDEIVKSINKNQISQTQKKQLQKQFASHQLQQKRLTRQKDSLNNYELFQLIGKGAFGQVRIARNKQSNEIVAIKRIEKKRLVEKKQLTSAYIEKELMIKNNGSQFLVKLYSTFQDCSYLYLVMEYVAGGDMLHHLIKRDILTEDQTRFYIAELILALSQMRSRKMIHRDIKPDNILIDKSGHIKISDFGLSKHVCISYYYAQMITIESLNVFENSIFQDRKSRHKHHYTHKVSEKQNILIEKILNIKERTSKVFSKVGTPDYISPQVLFAKQYDYSVDIWSVGVIMFQCLFGYPPFSDEDPKQVCKNVMNWSLTLKFPQDISVSVDAKRLILGMITQKSQRLGIEQIKGHSFFSKIQWNKLKDCQPPMIPILQNEMDTNYFEKYDQSQKWVDQSTDFVQRELSPQDMLDYKKSRSSVYVRNTSADYLFAGFDYKNIKFEPFKIIENQTNPPNTVKGLTRNQTQNCLKGRPSLKQNRTIIRTMIDKKNIQKAKEKKNENQCLRKYIIKKSIHFLGDSVIINSNKTTNSFLNTSSKLNHSISNVKEKSILCKESRLKQTKKIFNCAKTANKATF